jgi:minor extracellular serine protease Vpr
MEGDQGETAYSKSRIDPCRSGPPNPSGLLPFIARAEVSEFVVRRLLVLVSVLTLALPTMALARDPTGADRFTPSPIRGSIDPQLLPRSSDDSGSVTVMLELRDDPVAVAQAAAPDNEISAAQRSRIKADLKAKQDAIKDDITARGGRVLSQMQSAYNGIKVRIARSEVASLAGLPNVIGVHKVQVFERDNATSVPFLGVPSVWEDQGFTGEGVKIAVIDTGIDYTHANFGGPGTTEAYDVADAHDTTLGDAGDAGLFGPDAPKVKGGTDLVGDAYDGGADEGSPALIPHPDPDPLDCPFTDGSVGHGSHVSGTATGFGVLADGSTYPGPYDESTHDQAFEIGPGVAPEADLYFVRVFGCSGSTEVTTEAIDWAVDHQMNVINMSLGSVFGGADDPSAVASTNAAAAGVTVVTSAGNSGPAPYVGGSPGTATGAIATAAIDSNPQFPGVALDLTPGGNINTISANGIQPANGSAYSVVVLKDNPATAENEALGCSTAAYTAAGITPGGGQLAVTVRGTCARVARGVFGQQAGAAAVAMINTSAGFPPFEGPILSNPDTGVPFEVTIPFLGVQGPANSADANALRAASSVTTTAITLTNPGFRGFASFSSGGPRNGDSALKPDITAPGVSTISTASGTGNKGYVLSGTSMASPHVAGVAALVRQSHPTWSTEEIKAAIVNTGDPSGFASGYQVTRGGSGLVDPGAAASTSVIALGDAVAGDEALELADFHNSNLSFGFAELGSNYSATRTITVRNHGSSTVKLNASVAASAQSRPASVSFSASSVTVAAGGSAELDVTLNVPAASAGNSDAFREVSGNVVLSNSKTTLRVPYLLVPRALSDVKATLATPSFGTPVSTTVTNPAGVIPGTADFYQWGLTDAEDVNEDVLGGSGYDLRAVGVQSFDFTGGDKLLVFAISTHDRWSTGAVNEFDINIDTGGQPGPEYAVVGVDFGAITAGSFNGQVGAFVFDLRNGGAVIQFLAQAPTDSSTMLLPVLASDLGLTQQKGSFTYQAVSFSLEGNGQDPMGGTAGYNPWAPAVTNGQIVTVNPGATAQVNVTFDRTASRAQTPLGVMVVSHDNASGAAEATLLAGPSGR